MITPEEIVGEEWASWYRLSPQERWRESEKLWEIYLYLGGPLDPEPDTQSPFFDPEESSKDAAHGRSRLRILRRSRV
jgi:hypothetical protein